MATPSLALGLAVFTGAASMRCLDALLPVLAVDFDLSIGSAGVAVSAYAISYGVCQLMYGPLGDRLGAYTIVRWATLAAAVTTAACALAPSFATLIALRFLSGAVAAAVGPLTLAWLSRSAPLEKRSVAFARMTAAAITGAAAGQFAGGVIGAAVGWRFVFVTVATLFAVSGLWLTAIARRHPLVVNVGGSPADVGGRSASMVSLAGRPAVVRVLVAVGLEGFAFYMSLTYVAAMLVDRLSIGPARAGSLLALYGVGGIAFVLLAPRILRRLGTARRAVAGGAVLGVGFAGLAFVNSQAAAAASLFAIGFGFLMLHNVLQLMAADMAPEAIGTSIALFAALSCLAQAAGAGAGGFVFDRAGPTTTCILSAAMLTCLGVGASAMLRRRT